ncbi:MAG: restriction endonuclease subunit S [Pseudomonadales bacterium]|nr:restriction endonuclease subunit S [Pseudomonadales bacterium]
MSEKTTLPNGWVLAPLMAYVEWVKTGVDYYKGEKKYFSTSSVKKGVLVEEEGKYTFESRPSRANRLVRLGDIIQARMADTNKALLCKDDISEELISTGFFQIRSLIKSDSLKKYLYYYLNSEDFLSQKNKFATGSTQVALTDAGAKNIKIAIAPKAEQARIVEKLEELFSELDEGVRELKSAQVKLAQYRQSLLKSAIEGVLTQKWRDDNKNKIKETGHELLKRMLNARKQRWEKNKLEEFKEKGKKPAKNWQEKYPEPVQPDITDLPQLPEGWVWASLDQCIEQAKDITDGPFGSNLKTEHYIKSGPRVIRLQNIGDGEFLNDKAHISKERYNNLIKHAVEPNDILIAMMGEDLPRACLPPNDISPAIVKADCARVRLNNEIVNSHLVMLFLNSIPVRSRTKSAVKGVGRPRINLGYIRSIAIPIPPQLEQTALLAEINNQLDSVNRQIIASKISLKQSEVQRKNILKSAFSGELVSQDENDEPAFLLLEAIKKEREEQAKQAKPSKERQTKKKVDVMNTLLEVLTEEDRWIDAQEAFKKCGIVDGSSIDRVEEIYAELRKLEKIGQIEIERNGKYDQIRFIKEDKCD